MAYFEKNKLTDEDGNTINPATDESIILLRRMIKLLESQNATDIGNRQRITIDAGTLPNVTTVGTITNALPAGTNNIGFVNQDQRQFIDVARTSYNTGIRSRLTFS
jgi:hypothetical protein